MNVLLKPGQKIKPPVGPNDVPSLVNRIYALNVIQVKELNSYDDRNFYIKTEPHADYYGSCTEFILKVSNSIDSNSPGLIEELNRLLDFISNHGLPVPKAVCIKGSEDAPTVIRIQLGPEDTDQYAIRLLTFIPGDVLCSVELTPDILYKVGVETGKLSQVMCGFESQILKDRKYIWNMLNIPQLTEFMFAISDDQKRIMLQQIIDEFNERIVPVVNQLDFQINHGDINEQNILIDPKGASGSHEMFIIDFGDVPYSPRICDLAIVCAYLMLFTPVDPLKTPNFIISGYLSTIQNLKQLEIQLLPTLVASRLCQSLILGAYSHLSDPNNQYLLTTAINGWRILEVIRSKSHQELLDIWMPVKK